MFCVDVAINLPVKSIFKQFTYGLPQEMEFLDRGWRVVVPFGAQKVEGFIVRRGSVADLPQETRTRLKLVEAALGDRPWFDEEMLATAQWLADYYMCSLAEAMRLFVPGKTSIRRQAVKDDGGHLLRYEYQERLKAKTLLAFQLTEAGREALGAGGGPRLQAQLQALKLLSKSREPLTLQELGEYYISPSTARTLAKKGWALTVQKRILRNSYVNPRQKAAVFQLTEEQQQAVQKITLAVTEQRQETFLLQGITGSGKTEVYLRAAAQAVEQGRQVLMLVPEIALTAQLVERFRAWFGDEIAVAHSKLSPNERGDVWYKMYSHQANILIGVRSAVFAPFANLGLVIIDEEHESSYKQEERPSYHARTVALTRCRHTHAPLLLGSATPSIESYYQAQQGRYTHLRLTNRANGSHLPQVEIVDMREELKAKNFSVLSRKLKQALVETAASGEQAIILLNRRGYSTFVMCRDCGASITCPHCAVALVYHSAGEDMRCHYCGNTAPVPQVCPSCQSKRIKFFGTGTQKAEVELMALPEVRVLRLDQDSTIKKFAHLEILQQFARGERNVLIGTQMVAKGHDIPNVTLVGVLAADSSMNLPDFRASERTFSLLTQAAGRAGRGDKPGHVLFQAYDVENRVLQLAARQDYNTFAQEELQAREEFFYPPYAEMLKMTIWEKDEGMGMALATRLVSYLQQLQMEDKLGEVMILGPFPALVAKVRDLYRFHVVVKAKQLQLVKKALLDSEFKELKNLYFDVDPTSVV